jgi:hypothetical protein
MLRKATMALCAIASIGMLAPDMALARGGGGGSGGHGGGSFGGGGGGRGAGGMSAGSFAGRSVGGGNFNGGNFNGGNVGNSFARATPNAGVQGNFQGNFQGNRFAGANSGGRGRFDHGFRRGRGFFAGGVGIYDNYWDYPDYAYDDYSDNGGCYVVQRRVQTQYGWRVRPVQVCG